MATVQSAYFGEVEYDEGAVVEFPAGLPAFEAERRFVEIRRPDYQPLVFLQSLATPALSFIAIDIQNVVLDYALDIAAEDLETLGGAGPVSEFRILALVTVAANGEVSANLRAPLVVHRPTRRGVQAIQSGAAYSCRHPLGSGSPSTEEVSCS
jgi:flagellar assembly factor FliW